MAKIDFNYKKLAKAFLKVVGSSPQPEGKDQPAVVLRKSNVPLEEDCIPTLHDLERGAPMNDTGSNWGPRWRPPE